MSAEYIAHLKKAAKHLKKASVSADAWAQQDSLSESEQTEWQFRALKAQKLARKTAELQNGF